jgi:hypothetical protein
MGSGGESRRVDIPKSRLNNSLNGIVNLAGCLKPEGGGEHSCGPLPDSGYAQTRVRSQDWATGDDQRKERDRC